jgi:hypothetical protein
LIERNTKYGITRKQYFKVKGKIACTNSSSMVEDNQAAHHPEDGNKVRALLTSGTICPNNHL